MFTFFLQKNKNILVFILLISISMSFISYKTNIVHTNISGILLTITAPIYNVLHYVYAPIKSIVNGIINFTDKIEDMKKAQIEIEKKQRLFADYELLLEENQRLKKILDYKKDYNAKGGLFDKNYSIKMAEIIMKDPQSHYKTLIINKGSSHGIYVNMPVVAIQKVKQIDNKENYESVVVGKVIQTSLFASKIIPIIDKRCIIYATLKKSKYPGIIQGKNELKKELAMTHIDKSATIVKNDEVITSGGKSIFPKGLKIGYVKKDSSTTSSFMKEIIVIPYLNLSKLKTVVLINKPIPKDLQELIKEK